MKEIFRFKILGLGFCGQLPRTEPGRLGAGVTGKESPCQVACLAAPPASAWPGPLASEKAGTGSLARFSGGVTSKLSSLSKQI